MLYTDDDGSNYTPLQTPTSPYAPVKAPAPPPATSAATGAALKTLFTYDAAFSDFADLLADAHYPGAKLSPIKNIKQLATELGKYATIDTLVIFTHSIPGSLLLGGTSKTSADVNSELAKSKAKVTAKIVFEGCSIMKDPIDTCKMIKSISNPATVAIGFSYFSVIQPIKFDFRKVTDAGVVQAQFDQFDKKYWLKPLPAAKDAVGKQYRLGRRWFRDTLDNTVAEQVQRGIVNFASLNKIAIKTLKEAEALKQNYDDAPVASADIITVANIADVAKG